VGWKSNEGDSFFSSSIGGNSDIALDGGDSDISSGHTALTKTTRAQLVHYANQGARIGRDIKTFQKSIPILLLLLLIASTGTGHIGVRFTHLRNPEHNHYETTWLQERTESRREQKGARKGLRTDPSDASFVSGGLLNTNEKRETNRRVNY
jgi:hypothetical protein